MIFGSLALAVAVIVISQVTYNRPFAVEFGNYQRGKLTWLRIDLSLGILQLETPEFGITISRDEALFLALLFPAFALFRKAVMPPKHPVGGFPVIEKPASEKDTIIQDDAGKHKGDIPIHPRGGSN